MDAKLLNLIKKPITIEPYYYKVYVVVGKEEFQALIENNPDWYEIQDHEPHVKRSIHHLDDTVGVCYRVKDAKGSDLCILEIGDLKDKMLDRIIIHEGLHVILGMFDSRGLDISITNEEALCYHLEHLYDEVHKHLKKRGA